MNAYENIKANEDFNRRSHLQSSANVLTTFQFHLQKILACANSERDCFHLWPPYLKWRFPNQIAATGLKLDRNNPKKPCQGCLVDVASNHISACRTYTQSVVVLTCVRSVFWWKRTTFLLNSFLRFSRVRSQIFISMLLYMALLILYPLYRYSVQISTTIPPDAERYILVN